MKKNIFAGVILGTLIFTQSAASVSALTPIASPGAIKQRMETRQTLRQENRDQILENIASRIEERFDRHEERLQNWIDRASTHLTALKEKGKDVANAEKALETAKTSLATAIKLGDDAVAKLRAVTPTNWTTQKADALAARAAVKEAQVAYAQVIKDMKQALVELKKANQ